MAKSDKLYFENLRECVLLSHKAANYLVECLENYDADKINEMLEKMHEIEHSADIKKHEMHDMLIRAFVTPVDREDLDMLSHRLDDISDTIEEILQKFYMYDIKEIRPEAIEFSKKIIYACEIIESIIIEFENFKRSKKLHEMIVELNSTEEECDKLYLKAMHDLTTSENDVLKVISWRKIYEHLESCADLCENVGECVRSVVMKNT